MLYLHDVTWLSVCEAGAEVVLCVTILRRWRRYVRPELTSSCVTGIGAIVCDRLWRFHKCDRRCDSLTFRGSGSWNLKENPAGRAASVTCLPGSK